MKCCRVNVFCAAILALLATVGIADAQLTLVPNGDFSTADGADWVFASVGAEATFPDTGGNPGGFGTIDQTASGWGGVLVSEASGSEGISLTSLGLVAGNTYTFSVDMINLGSGSGTADAGMKIENWNAGAIINDSTDQVFGTTSGWETYTFDWLVDSSATSLKFVPLMVGQADGSSVGFDNVGVIVPVPEPGTLGFIALGMVGLVARRRRS